MSQSPSAPIRILFADDHVMVREALSQICNAEPDMKVVGQAADGRAACRQAASVKPDVVVMDINMPVLDGVQATGQITVANPDIGVIILTMYRQDQYVFEAIKAGARAYLLKDADSDELLRAIRTVAAGEALLDPVIAKKMIDEFRDLQNQSDSIERLTPLIEQELNVLRLVAHGFPNSEIGDRLGLSEKTVRNRLTVIFEKLHVNNRTQAALYALRQGLASLDEDNP
jgi:DNA-binding NarL/FixJ family response regulator